MNKDMKNLHPYQEISKDDAALSTAINSRSPSLSSASDTTAVVAYCRILILTIMSITVVVTTSAAITSIFGDDMIRALGLLEIPVENTPLPFLRASSSFSTTSSTPSDKTKTRPTSLQKTTGVSFGRTISEFPTDTSFALNFSRSHCEHRDEYGDDDCHYAWGDELVAEYSILLPHIHLLTHSARAIGHFEIDDKLPWSFECALCGQDCVLKVPVIDLEYTYPMPSCPIVLPPTKQSHTMTFDLWKHSPTHGLILTKIKGNVIMYKNYQRKDILTNVSVSIDVR